MGDQCLKKKLKKKLGQNKFNHKTEVATIFTDVTDFDNELNLTSASELKLLSNVHF